ncbi:MAG: MerR family transcriptional regulator [Bacteroidaceae bacterium]
MAFNKDKELKMYFSISEVATQFGVAESVLRFWEKEFPNIHPRKTPRNVRQYTRQDIEEVRTVYTLLKVRGMKIAAAREMLVKNRKGAANMTQVLSKLESIRAELMDISKELAEL